ncbi:hypothetical protein [Pseudoalteromonas sp.]|uniref:hypothetical protein n=1 Tax=Pseudoalteromonas sp. TaxID=53249 RepID=UPI003001C2F7
MFLAPLIDLTCSNAMPSFAKNVLIASAIMSSSSTSNTTFLPTFMREIILLALSLMMNEKRHG